MQTILCILIFSLFFLFVKNSKIDMTSKRSINFFLLVWFISLILSAVNVCGMRDVSAYTLLLLYTNILCFVIGFYSYRIPLNLSIRTNKDEIGRQVDTLIKSKWFIIVLVFIIVYTYSLLVIYFDKIVFYQSLGDVRHEYFEENMEMYGPHYWLVSSLILTPFSIVSLPLFAYLLFYNRNIVCFALGFYLFGYSSLGGGRVEYMFIFLGIIFMHYCLMDSVKNKKKAIGIILISSVLVFFLLTIITGARFGNLGVDKATMAENSEQTIDQISRYFEGPIAAFDYSIDNNYRDQIGGFQYGKLTLSSVYECFYLFFHKLGFNIGTPPLVSLSKIKQDARIDIGDGGWNALYTAVFFFYLDFGVLGVIVFGFLFGIMFRFVISRVYYFGNLPSIMLATVVFQKVVNSFMDMSVTSALALLPLIAIYYWAKKTKIC